MQPLVSVVIATHNQAKYLGYTIESVLNQTYSNIELTVVDDGSTDDTPSIARRFAGRIRYIRQVNMERGAARNRGLRESRGEYISFLDSDDIWVPDKIDREVQFLQTNPNVGLVYSDREFIDAAGKYIGKGLAPSHRGRVTRQLLRENFICLSANLMRRSDICAIGGFPEDRMISGSEDWVAWAHLSTRVEFAHLKAITVLYRIHPSNTMNNAPAMERAMSHATQAIASADWLAAEYQRVFPYMYAKRALINAINYCSAGQRSTTWHYLWKAACYSPSIVLDIRFPYTALRNTLPSLARSLAAKRRARSATSAFDRY